MKTKLTWKEIRTSKWSFAWKLFSPMSGGFKRTSYGWSFGCRIGGALFTRFVAACVVISLCACTEITDPATGKKHLASTLTIDQRKALLTTITELAAGAASAAGGGPVAAAGLNALGSVLQGYVGKLIPSTVVASSPGVPGVGAVAASAISPTTPVTQADVNAVFAAAQAAATK